jgi:hypothetical protein
LQVLVLDHSDKVAEKIRISGGGRSNFTNQDIAPRSPHKHFWARTRNFAAQRLEPLHAADFVGLGSIATASAFHEKHKGQSVLRPQRARPDRHAAAPNVRAMGGVTRWQPCSLHALQFSDSEQPRLHRSNQPRRGAGPSRGGAATGGLSIPEIGATDLGYRLAPAIRFESGDDPPCAGAAHFRGLPTWQPCLPASAGLSLPVAHQHRHRQAAPLFSGRFAVHPPGLVRASGACKFRATGSVAARFR